MVSVAGDLGLAAGGTGVVGRALVTAASGAAARRGATFECLHFGEPETAPGGSVATRHASRNVFRLTSRLVAAEAANRKIALLFDHVGPSRVQALLPDRWRAPYAVYVHGVEVWRPLGWQRRRALRFASVVLANSRYTVDRARAAGAPLENVEIVPPVLEERAPDGVADRPLLADLGRGFFLIAGRMSSAERYKGHDELIDAFSSVRDARPDARLVVAGGGDDAERLRSRAAAAGLGDAVRFTGFVSEATLDALFEASLAFVMPSRDEGFGLVYLSAMRASKPCVALRGTAAEELISDGETGFLVPSGDRESLAAALVSLRTDRDRATRLGAAGRRRWEAKHQPAAFRASIENVVDRLLRESDVRS